MGLAGFVRCRRHGSGSFHVTLKTGPAICQSHFEKGEDFAAVPSCVVLTLVSVGLEPSGNMFWLVFKLPNVQIEPEAARRGISPANLHFAWIRSVASTRMLSIVFFFFTFGLGFCGTDTRSGCWKHTKQVLGLTMVSRFSQMVRALGDSNLASISLFWGASLLT